VQVAGPAGKKLAIAKLRPKLKNYLATYDLDWADVQPAFEAVEISTDQLKEALLDVEGFLRKLSTDFVQVGMKLAIAKLKPKLSRDLKKHHLDWADVKPALELVDTLEELQAALQNTQGFLQALLAKAGGPAKKLVIAKLRPKMQPYLLENDLVWSDMKPALEQVDSLEELQYALKNVKTFLKKLILADGPAAKKLMLVKLRRKLNPRTQSEGIDWEVLQDAVEKTLCDSPTAFTELREALTDSRKLQTFIDVHLSHVMRSAPRRAFGVPASLSSSFPQASSLPRSTSRLCPRGLLSGSRAARPPATAPIRLMSPPEAASAVHSGVSAVQSHVTDWSVSAAPWHAQDQAVAQDEDAEYATDDSERHDGETLSRLNSFSVMRANSIGRHTPGFAVRGPSVRPSPLTTHNRESRSDESDSDSESGSSRRSLSARWSTSAQTVRMETVGEVESHAVQLQIPSYSESVGDTAACVASGQSTHQGDEMEASPTLHPGHPRLARHSSPDYRAEVANHRRSMSSRALEGPNNTHEDDNADPAGPITSERV